MDPSRSKRGKTLSDAAAAVAAGADNSQDLISNLPEEVKGRILSYLSTRHAVQTSVLSSKWRYTWASVPEISIRESDFSLPVSNLSGASTRVIRSKFVKFVDVLFYLHTGSILKFELETGKFNGEHYFQDAINRWILHLSRRNELREFSFMFCSVYLYRLPTSLFSCHGLSSLKLRDCYVKLPTGFRGFKSLSTLELQGCYITSDDLEKFVSSCPISELLVRTQRYPIADFNLKISAPKLKKLVIHGKFVSLVLRTPCLVKACFELDAVPTGINGRANLVEALGSLPEVEILGLHQQFFAYLAAGSLPNSLPLPLDKLRILTLDVNLSSPEEASLTQLLLQNAPNLQEIYLMNSTSRWPLNARKWHIGPADLFMSLRTIELYEFFISEAEIAFLKFMLGTAPLLERLTIVREKDTDAKEKEATVEMLRAIPKVSRNFEITFE